jgi:hypothetical protein
VLCRRCPPRQAAVASAALRPHTCKVLLSTARLCLFFSPLFTCACAVQPCELYYNDKAPAQQLFAAAAALHLLTGTAQYRADVDRFYALSNPFMFFNNWNNVVTQVRAALHVHVRRKSCGTHASHLPRLHTLNAMEATCSAHACGRPWCIPSQRLCHHTCEAADIAWRAIAPVASSASHMHAGRDDHGHRAVCGRARHDDARRVARQARGLGGRVGRVLEQRRQRHLLQVRAAAVLRSSHLSGVPAIDAAAYARIAGLLWSESQRRHAEPEAANAGNGALAPVVNAVAVSRNRRVQAHRGRQGVSCGHPVRQQWGRAQRCLPRGPVQQARRRRRRQRGREESAVLHGARARLPDEPQVRAERLQVQHGGRGGVTTPPRHVRPYMAHPRAPVQSF